MARAPLPEPRPPHPGFGTGASVWLFRHGEVHEDWQGLAYGGLDVPLSARGEADTDGVVERFQRVPFRGVLSSNLSRALRLGRGLSEAAGAPLTVDPGLAEIQRGHWQGRRVEEIHSEFEHEVAAFYADPWTWNGHGGETDADVLERAWPVLERGLLERGGPLAVTAHYNVVRVLVAHMLGIPPGRSFLFRVDLSGANELVDGPDGWSLVRANVRAPR